MLLSTAVNAQRKRAFLVGISHYDTALTGYQWNNINGVEDINLLNPTLNPNRSLGPISSGDVKVFSCSPESKECLPLIHGFHET